MFLFRLALKMGKTVEELRNAMTQRELMEWLAFYDLEPWGVEFEELQTGMVCALIHNTNIAKRHQAKNITDFMPIKEHRDKVMRRAGGIRLQSRKEMQAQIMGLVEHQKKYTSQKRHNAGVVST